jgi:hypothetical protein
MITAVLNFVPVIRPEAIPADNARLLRLFGLDRLSEGRRRLVCHWHRTPEGRLVCIWEPDIGRVWHC